ncbi:hypothetical protein SAMN02983003_3170 [Devosia enhydra]|uniref:Helix-hairpin-helix domain-containing protein n=1 Tax=Devosia enhydra TaxID=665118 RepID=A0A1K2I0U9_9HYPH|nr:helix-hairpin-helix domain-containing protein [Devosia enhydra]SFZ85998.1 hypothetical protein SAMN02983003_3170 [Devosia enhydra]
MDKLTDIDGIGPVAERALAAIGITTFAQLAALEPQALMEKIDAAGGLRGSPDYHHWVMSARARVATPGPFDTPAQAPAAPVPDNHAQAQPEHGQIAAAETEPLKPFVMETALNPVAGSLPHADEIDLLRQALEEELDDAREAIASGANAASIRDDLIAQRVTLQAALAFMQEADQRYGEAIASIDLGLGIGVPDNAVQGSGELLLVTVTGPAAGRWRAGLQFGADPRKVRVTAEQLLTLRSDAALTVS